MPRALLEAAGSETIMEVALRNGHRASVRGIERRGTIPAGARSCSIIPLPASIRARLYTRVTDMRRGFNGLSAQVDQVLQADPYSGHIFVFRGLSLPEQESPDLQK